jgi:4-hydroxythreonine-4-phosphate dehydrogenase
LNIINSVEELNPKRINIINCSDDEIKVELGRSTVEAGKAAFAALEQATEDLKKGALDAIVTAPINKKNIQSADFHFPGHTEYLEEKFGTGTPSLMLLMNDVMRVAVVTGHIPVAEVSNAITKELIIEKLLVFNKSLKEDFMIVRPRIAVLGLNPHAGDEGVIGDEEQKTIIPALKEAEKQGVVCVGPYAADGFFGSGQFSKFDGILAMYHDQGLIPFKSISMDSGVNFTAGLSVIRTSPAHGTAYDLAGKNMASEDSFRQAIYTTCDIYQNRMINKEITANPLKVEKRAERSGRVE